MKSKVFKLIFSFLFFLPLIFYFYFFSLGEIYHYDIEKIEDQINNKNIPVIFYGSESLNNLLPDLKIKEKKALFIPLNKTPFIDVSIFKNNKNILFIYEKSAELPENIKLLASEKRYAGHSLNGVLLQLPFKTMASDSSGIKIKNLMNEFELFDGQKNIKYGGKEWQYFGWTNLKIEGIPSRCLWIHPATESPIEIVWENIASKNGRIFLGIGDSAEKKNVLEFKITQYISDKIVNENTQKISVANSKGWKIIPFEKSDKIHLSIKSEKNGKNHYCILGEVYE